MICLHGGALLFGSKERVNGVALGVSGDDAATEAYGAIIARVGAAHPDVSARRVLVCPMAPPGLNMILGVHRDPMFGAVVMVGVGGIFVEIMEDVSLAPAPVDLSAARGVDVNPMRVFAAGEGVRMLDAVVIAG